VREKREKKRPPQARQDNATQRNATIQSIHPYIHPEDNIENRRANRLNDRKNAYA
jgi:hypothetical protein